MPRRRGRVIRAAAVLLAQFAVAGAGLGPVAGVGPVPGTPLPHEPPVTYLPDPLTDARAFDLDADGVLELVTVNAAAKGGDQAIQAWWVAADGSAEPSNRVPIRVADVVAPGDVMAGFAQPARLLTAARHGRDVLLVATTISDTPNAPCCLTIWEVTVAGRRLALRQVAATGHYGNELVAADLDADGTDELFVTEGPPPGVEGSVLDVAFLRWDGAQFGRSAFEIEFRATCCGVAIMDAGETDGRPGEEVLLVGYDPQILRLTMRAGQPVIERQDAPQINTARAVELPDGAGILTAEYFGDAYFSAWPRDGDLEPVLHFGSAGIVTAVFGEGPATRLLIANGLPPSAVHVVNVHQLIEDNRENPSLIDVFIGRFDGAATVNRDARAGVFIGITQNVPLTEALPGLMPFVGIVPGGLPGFAEAFVATGRVIHAGPGERGEQPGKPVALLPGQEPVGAVGPDGRWMALLSGVPGSNAAFLRPGVTSLNAFRGHLSARLVATETIMAPEADGGRLNPTFLGVARDAERGTTLLVGNGAVTAEVTAPPGTTVGRLVGGGSEVVTVGADGVAYIPLLDPAGPDTPDGTAAAPQLWAVTPGGHGYVSAWRIRRFRQPPPLEVVESEELLDLDPTVSGQTLPDALVTVSGTVVAVSATGTFSVPVAVGILPTDVRVVATDAVGNRTERVVTLVWPLDYRRLPFVPIVVLLTVVAAGFLFVRRPTSGPPPHSAESGSTFEDIGG